MGPVSTASAVAVAVQVAVICYLRLRLRAEDRPDSRRVLERRVGLAVLVLVISVPVLAAMVIAEAWPV